MNTSQGPVIVGIDDSPGSQAAVRWAVDDARTRHAPLRLIHAYGALAVYGRDPAYLMQESELSLPRKVAEQFVATMVDLCEAQGDVAVSGEAIEGDPSRVLIDASAEAALLVMGSRQLKTLGSSVLGSVGSAASSRAACPAVVVRGPAGWPAEGAAVVAGVDGTESSEAVLAFAFAHASRHNVALRAVFCWHPDQAAAMLYRPEAPAPIKAEAWLAESLAGWGEKYPDVVVHAEVIRDHAASGLVDASSAQYLLVVGSRGRHALVGTLLGSVTQGVLHHATCPVAIVPTHDR